MARKAREGGRRMSAIVNRGHAALDRLSRAFGIAKGERQELFAEALEELAERAGEFVTPPPTNKGCPHGHKEKAVDPSAGAQARESDTARQTQEEIAAPSPSQNVDGDPDVAPAQSSPGPAPVTYAPVRQAPEEKGSASDVVAAARSRISIAGRRQ